MPSARLRSRTFRKRGGSSSTADIADAGGADVGGADVREVVGLELDVVVADVLAPVVAVDVLMAGDVVVLVVPLVAPDDVDVGGG